MFDFDNIRDLNYQLNAGKEDYPWIELKMSDIKSSKYLNVKNELFKLIMMMNMDDDLKVEDQTVHNWLKKCIIFPFSNMVDIKYHDKIAISLANDVIKQYNVCAQLNLLYTFQQRFYKNLNDAYTKYGNSYLTIQ